MNDTQHDVELVGNNPLGSYISEMSECSDLLSEEEETSLAIKIRERLEQLKNNIFILPDSPVTDYLKTKLEKYEKRSFENDKAFAYDSLMTAIKKVMRKRASSRDHKVVSFFLEDDYKAVEEYKETMAKANLRLVITIAKGYTTAPCVTKLDLIQEGNAGLLRAIYRFDPYKGYRFATYASWWIRQAIQRAVLCQGRIIRWPVHVYEANNAINKQRKDKNNWNKTDQQIGVELGVNPEIVQSITFSKGSPLSLDAPIKGTNSSSNDDFLSTIADDQKKSPDQVVARKELSSIIEKLLNTLPPREAAVIKLRYGIGCKTDHTLQQVAQRFDISRERVRQIQSKAENKLKRIFKNNNLGIYLHD